MPNWIPDLFGVDTARIAAQKLASVGVPCEICGGMGITYEGHPCPQGCRNSLAQSITGDISAMNDQQGQLVDKAEVLTGRSRHHNTAAEDHAKEALRLSDQADLYNRDEHNVFVPGANNDVAKQLHEAAGAHALAAVTHRAAITDPTHADKAEEHSNRAHVLTHNLKGDDYDEEVAQARDAMGLAETERELQNWGRL